MRGMHWEPSARTDACRRADVLRPPSCCSTAAACRCPPSCPLSVLRLTKQALPSPPNSPPAGFIRQQQRGVRLAVAAAAGGSATAAGTRPPPSAAPAAEHAPHILPNGVVDYYELLGVDDMASSADIKAAYRSQAKVCHVDIAGDTTGNRQRCILLNEVSRATGEEGSKGAGEQGSRGQGQLWYWSLLRKPYPPQR